MFWEMVATGVAGVGAGGLGFALRRLSGRLPRMQAPRWIVPVFAGLGMLGFQVYSEYSWFDHQKQLLPEHVVVVKAVSDSSIWRPWSLLFPQTLRFLAIDAGNAVANKQNPALVLADVYAFERRLAARRVRQVFHCEQSAWAVFSEELNLPLAGEALGVQWHRVTDSDAMLAAVC